jgi:hypothetical protein
MSVLVYIPTYADAMQPETLQSVKAQDYGQMTIEVGRHNPYLNDKSANILAQQERARAMTLDGGFDALVFVEHDMQVPAHGIRTLYETDAPVVYGVYLFRHNQYMLSAFRYDNDRNIGMSLMQYPAELEQARRAKEWQVSGVGFGCTLVRRDVLERIPFRLTESDPYADMVFARDCLHAGVKQIARFDVPCLHYDPEVMRWLDVGRDMLGTLAKVKALQNVNVAPRGVLHRLEIGNEYELPSSDVYDYKRAGFVEVIGSVVTEPDPTPEPEATPEPAKVTKRTPSKRKPS